MRKGVSEPTRVGPNLVCPQVVLNLQVCKGPGLSYLWGPQGTEGTKNLLREGIRKIPITNFLSHVAYFMMVLRKGNVEHFEVLMVK